VSGGAVSRLSFEALYDDLFRYVHRSARAFGIPAHAADDVVQDVFVVVHRRLPEFDGRAPRAWVTRILVNVVREHRRTFRRRGDHDELDAERTASAEATPQREVERSEAARLLSSILEAMDEDRRVVFVLAELEDLPASEIAEITGVGVNTVSSRLRLARRDYDAAIARLRARDEWRQR
jgi:RNA polymerase sigma-70 factor (ECF subfamily)